MSVNKFGLVIAVEEHLLSGNPITRLESLVLFGVPDVTRVITDLRRKGWKIEASRVPYAKALVRINEHATLIPPASLPIREIHITEYRITK